MVSGQNSPGQVIEPRPAVLAPVALPMPLVMAMADHRGTGTGGAANSVRPSMASDQLITLSIKDVRLIICGEAMGSVPADGRCLPSQQPKPFEGTHDLLSDTMVAPLGSSVSILESRMSHPG
jgi:hypothetical protein